MKSAQATDQDAAAARLDDYIRGVVDDVRASDYEEDLFERALAGTARELTFRAGLGATLRAMNARGTLDLWITASDVERLRAAPDLRVVVYELDLAHPVDPEVPPDTDLLITRIPVDLRGIGRLEAEVVAEDGRLLKRMPDIAFDPVDGAVYACCEAELARTVSSTQRTITRVFATDDSGRRLVLELPAF